MVAVLKLVGADQFSETVELHAEREGRDAHSLQAAFGYTSPWHITSIRYLIDRFSSPGDTVLDAACGSGIVGFECLERSRDFIGVESDCGLLRLAQARLKPADLPELFLRVQTLNAKRPVDLELYKRSFAAFFNVDTFIELVNLRAAVGRGGSDVDAFIQFVVASILHGHSVSHLSAYTSPNAALAPEAQHSLNERRGEQPSHRPVVPRILKKTAQFLRDGVPASVRHSNTSRGERTARILSGPASNMASVRTGAVSLAVLCPQQPGLVDLGLRSWLRAWWLGVDGARSEWQVATLDEWRDHVNEVLLELARVVKPGGRAVLRLGNGRWGSKPVRYATEVTAILESCLSRYWKVDGTVLESIVDSNERTNRGAAACQLLVLRRR